MTLFIADFGGSLGFLLGVSILSVLEIVEGIIISIYHTLKNRKRYHDDDSDGQEKGDGRKKEDFDTCTSWDFDPSDGLKKRKVDKKNTKIQEKKAVSKRMSVTDITIITPDDEEIKYEL